MKKFFVIFCLLFSSTFVFANEYSNTECDIYDINQDFDDIEYSELNKSFIKIFAGASLLGNMAVPGIIGTFMILYTVLGRISGPLLMMSLDIPLGIVGGILLAHGIREHKNHSKKNNSGLKEEFYQDKSESYLRIGIINASISGVSLTALISGIVLYQVPSKEKRTIISLTEGGFYGFFFLVFGGIGLAVCLPMMIASLAMSAWCKGQLAKLTPELSLSHDNKKDLTEGYSVRMGLRVRL